METKRDIRKQMLCARDRLTDREWETYSDRITEQVVSHPLFVQAKEIWCYVSMGKEVCTEQILVSAWRAGKRTAVPKVTGKREMKFYYIESLNDLETGAFGILEPKEEKKGADCCLEKSDLLMLVPGVSFDPAEEGSDMEEDFTTRIFRKWKDAIRLDLRLRCRWQIRFLLRHMTFGWNM